MAKGVSPVPYFKGDGSLLAKVNALPELQVKGGEELRTVFVRTLLASVLDRAFKGEL